MLCLLPNWYFCDDRGANLHGIQKFMTPSYSNDSSIQRPQKKFGGLSVTDAFVLTKLSHLLAVAVGPVHMWGYPLQQQDNNRTITAAYRCAGLISNNAMTEVEMKSLTRSTFQSILSGFLLLSSPSLADFVKYSKNSSQCFSTATETHHFAISFWCRHTANCTSATTNREASERHCHWHFDQENIPNFPDAEQFKVGAVQFQPTIARADDQTQASYDEQLSALRVCIPAVDAGTDNPPICPCPIALVRPPGCGKTHMILIVDCYCFREMLTRQ